jgi:maltoporin
MGIFTLAPTSKPKGGYYTRPELRVFGDLRDLEQFLEGRYHSDPGRWRHDGFTPSPYANGHTNNGWLFGTQVEWFF